MDRLSVGLVLLTTPLLIFLSAVPASSQTGPDTVDMAPPDVEPGRFTATLAPWAAVEGEIPRVVDQVHLEGYLNPLVPRVRTASSCDPRVEVTLALQMTRMDQILRGDPVYTGVTSASRQTLENAYAILVVDGARSRSLVHEQVPVFAGGSEPPPEPSFFWMREVGEAEVLATVRYSGTVDIDRGYGTYANELPDDLPVQLEWTLRIVPAERVLRSHGHAPDALRPSARVAAIQDIMCGDSSTVETIHPGPQTLGKGGV